MVLLVTILVISHMSINPFPNACLKVPVIVFQLCSTLSLLQPPRLSYSGVCCKNTAHSTQRQINILVINTVSRLTYYSHNDIVWCYNFISNHSKL